MPDGANRRVVAYGLAVAFVVLIIGGRWLFHPLLGDRFVFTPCLLAVIAAGWIGGRGPALAAVALGAVGALLVLVPPHGSLMAESRMDVAGILFLILSGVGVAWLSGALHKAQRDVKATNRLLEARVLERTEELAEAVARYQESEARSSLAMRSSRIGFFELNLEDLSAKPSPEHARIFGYDVPPATWSRERFLSHVHPEDRAGAAEKIRAGIVAGTGWEFECRIHRTDGAERWIVVVAELPRDTASGPRRVVGTVQDITARKHAELSLAENERLLRIVTGNARVGLVVVGPGYRYLFANEAYAEIFGLAPGGIAGRRVPEVLPAAWPAIQPRLDRALSGERVEYELVTPAANESVHYFAVTYEPRPSEAGTYDVVVVVMDITARKSAEAASMRMHERIALATRAARLGIWDWDIRANHIEWDDQMYALYGRRRGDFAGAYEAWLAGVHPEDRERCHQESQDARDGLRDYESEYRVIWPDGTVRYIQALGEVHRDADGEAVRMVGVNLDVTSLKAAALEVRASQARLEAALESMTDAVFITDAQGNFTHLNDAFSTYHHLRPHETTEIELPKCQERIEALTESGAAMPPDQWAIPRALRGESASNTEYTLRRRDTGETWVGSYSFGPIRDESGGIVGAVVVARDITERKRLERDLIEREARFRQLAENIREVFWLLDLSDSRILYVSPAYELIWGRRCADLYESSADWLDGIHPEDRERVRASEAAHLTEGTYDVEYRIVRPDGGLRWIHDRGFPIRDTEGKVYRIAGVAEDITDQVEAAALRIKLEAQLLQSQKMEAVGQLAGGIAHDFNNLMMVISGYCESLLDGAPSDQEYHDAIVEIQRAGSRASELTRQLLAFSRKQVLAPQILDLNGLVAGMEGMLKRLIGEDVSLVTLLGAATPRVKVDPGQMHQVIMNMAVNARDAMPQGGNLTIETSGVQIDDSSIALRPDAVPGPYAVLAISDTGGGMEPAVRDRIFEPFFSTKGVAHGTGLGLSVVHGIVKQSGGRIEVYSEPGIGTTFKVYLPACFEAVKDASPAADTPRQGGAETILLVEDEDAVRKITAKALQRLGYQVMTASNGREALALASADAGHGIRLLITDVVMPEISGRCVAETLIAQNPALKVLFVSGYTDDVIVRHGVLQADVSFLQKPFSFRALASKIREVLDRD